MKIPSILHESGIAHPFLLCRFESAPPVPALFKIPLVLVISTLIVIVLVLRISVLIAVIVLGISKPIVVLIVLVLVLLLLISRFNKIVHRKPRFVIPLVLIAFSSENLLFHVGNRPSVFIGIGITAV
uniref:Uncharacterized protein n=1 Tax=Cucumis sativus TaxID=3659 RepID=A0A0A0K6N9_CUCSA